MDEAKTSNKLRVLKHFWQLGVAIAVVVTGAVAYLVWPRPADPLPYMIVSSVNYPFYYPRPMPDGLSYRQGSAKLDGELIVYSIGKGSKITTITEQAMPASPPDLGHLNGFTTDQTPKGNAAFGYAGKLPSAIILNSGTLVTLSGSAGVTPGQIKDIANNLSAVPAD